MSTRLTQLRNPLQCKRNFSANLQYPNVRPVQLYAKKTRSLPAHQDKPINIIMFHGMLASHEHWKTLTNLLAQSSQLPLNILAFDLRNHGNSTYSEDQTYEHMAIDIKKYMNTQRIDTATLIGHTMGGKLAMFMSLVEPQMIDKLILIDSIPTKSELITDSRFDAMKAVPLDNIKTKREAEEVISKVIKDKTERGYLLRNLAETAERKFKWRVNIEPLVKSLPLMAEFPDLSGKIFDKDTMFITGKQTNLINDQTKSKIRQYFPKSKFEEYHGGHYVYAEHPSLISKLILPFLVGDHITVVTPPPSAKFN